jgi:hypothetical protein
MSLRSTMSMALFQAIRCRLDTSQSATSRFLQRIPHRQRPLAQQRMSLQHMPHTHRAPSPRPSTSICLLDNLGKKKGRSVCHHKGTSIRKAVADLGRQLTKTRPCQSLECRPQGCCLTAQAAHRASWNIRWLTHQPSASHCQLCRENTLSRNQTRNSD